jgi:hypothetical protein
MLQPEKRMETLLVYLDSVSTRPMSTEIRIVQNTVPNSCLDAASLESAFFGCQRAAAKLEFLSDVMETVRAWNGMELYCARHLNTPAPPSRCGLTASVGGVNSIGSWSPRFW